MQKTQLQTQSKGVGFVGLLTIAFIVLKLMDVIQWSWVWVLAPIWIPFGAALAVLFIALIVGLLRVSKTTYKKEAKLA